MIARWLALAALRIVMIALGVLAEPQDRFKGIVMLVTPWKDIS